MIRWQTMMLLCLIVTSVSPLAAAEVLREFSARQLAIVGDISLPGEIHVSAGRVRYETSVHGVSEIVIMKPAKTHACVLMPAQKEFMRLPPRDLDLVLASAFGPEVSYVQEPSEKIAGKTTDKYRIDSPLGLLYLWTQSSTGKPMRLHTANKRIRLEWRQVRAEPQPDTMFEKPPGYRNFMEQASGAPAG